MDEPPISQPLLIVLSGPSGVGKDAVLARMKRLGLPYHYVVTATTRRRRPTESDGADYHFVSGDEFQRMLREGELLEWAEVYGNYYGVPKSEVRQALAQGSDVIVKVDVQGSATIKKVAPEAVFIFLMPPSPEELERRLRKRHSESSHELELRLEKAEDEARQLPLFDYAITSQQDRLEDVIECINAIVTAEKCRVNRKPVAL